MPPREGWAISDDVAGRPKNPPFVEVSRHIVIRTQDVEISGVYSFDHEVDGLLRRPGPGRLFGAASGGKACKHEPGDQKVSAYSAAGRVSQLVLQRFRKSFQARL
jgi:hypothetical protein